MREAKKGKDVSRYLDAIEHLRERVLAPDDPDAELDRDWLEAVKKDVARETERMETELKGYKNNLIKESIRVRLLFIIDHGSLSEII